MGLATQIVALNPILYWPLDTGDNTGLNDLSGNARSGTISGDYDMTAYGPEHNTKGVRMFGGSKIVSPALGLAGVHDYTLMMMATIKPMPVTGTFLNLMGIGSDASPLTRGFSLQTRMNSTFIQLYNSLMGNVTVQTDAYSEALWHLANTSWKIAESRVTVYSDNTSATGQTGGGPQPLLSSDQLYVLSQTPVVVSHVALFDRALTSTEVSSVASQVAQWPWEIPINTPIPVPAGGTTDLTPVLDDTSAILSNQTTALPVLQQTKQNTDDIKGFWNGYQTVTLPSLNDTLASITAAVTTTVQTAGGAITSTLGDLFRSSSLDTLEFDDLTSGGTCTKVDVEVQGAFYGVIVRMTAWPEQLMPLAPDQDWYIPDFAVVQIWRDNDIVFRGGVHQRNWVHTPWPIFQGAFANGLGIGLTYPAMRVIVDWAEGCCGPVLLMRWP